MKSFYLKKCKKTHSYFLTPAFINSTMQADQVCLFDISNLQLDAEVANDEANQHVRVADEGECPSAKGIVVFVARGSLAESSTRLPTVAAIGAVKPAALFPDGAGLAASHAHVTNAQIYGTPPESAALALHRKVAQACHRVAESLAYWA